MLGRVLFAQRLVLVVVVTWRVTCALAAGS